MTAQTAGWTLGPVSLVRWKSSDGAEIEGVLHKPADFQPGQRVPAAGRDPRRAHRHLARR